MDRAAAEVLAARPHPHGFLAQEELWAVNRVLFDEGADAVQIARQMTGAYLRAWQRHPMGMLRASIANLPGDLLYAAGNSVRLDPAELLPAPVAGGGTGAVEQIAELSAWAFALLLSAGTLLLHALSLAITLGFLLSPALAGWLALAARRPFDEADWFRLYALFACLAFLSLHAIVHFEERFLAPVEPLIIVSGVTGIAEVARQRAAARRRARA
jgi:hypothetical protein